MSTALQSIASLMIDVDLGKARALARRSIDVIGAKGGLAQKAYSNLLLGNVESLSGNKEAAADNFCSSWAQAEAVKDHRVVACSIFGLSQLGERQAEWAKDAIIDHLNRFNDDQDNLNFASALGVLSQVLELQNNPEEAYKIGLKARAIFAEKNASDNLASIDSRLGFLSRKMKKFRSACAHFKNSFKGYRKLGMRTEAKSVFAWIALACAPYR